MIQQTFQQYALLREEECILKFLHTLATFANIDQESYRCELIVSPREGTGTPVPGWHCRTGTPQPPSQAGSWGCTHRALKRSQVWVKMPPVHSGVVSAHPEHPQQRLGLLRGDSVAKATRLGGHVWADGGASPAGASRCLKVAEGGEVPTPGSLPCTIFLSPWSSPLSKPLLEVVSLGCHRK